MPNTFRPRTPPTQDHCLAYARTCYSHLAGRLAVDVVDTLQHRELLVALQPKMYRVTREGLRWFAQLGIESSEAQANQVRFARRCLDWTERRHHLSGELGSRVLVRFRELKWIAPIRRTRAVRVTIEGKCKLWELLKIQIA